MQDWPHIMQIWKPGPATRRVGILLFDDFSNHCLANTVEPLRAANTLAGKALYAWQFLSMDGAAVVSSSRLPVTPEAALTRAEGDDLFIMPSYGFRAHASPANLRALRRAAHRWRRLAGLDTGAWLMAAAGLLDGRRATIHWDEITALAERFPAVEVLPERFVIDADRLTCGGASTSFDLALHLIREAHGPMLALDVAALFMPGNGAPRPEAPRSDSTLIDAAVALMRRNLDPPLPLPMLARQLGLGRKALEAAFRLHLNATPRAVYKSVRLGEARRLLRHGTRSVADAAALCGYTDPSAFTRAFRAEFGITPRDEHGG